MNGDVTTRCERGAPMIDQPLSLTSEETTALVCTICRSGVDLMVSVDDEMVPEAMVRRSPDRVVAVVPPLEPGLHNIAWSVVAASADWQMRSEVGMARFANPQDVFDRLDGLDYRYRRHDLDPEQQTLHRFALLLVAP